MEIKLILLLPLFIATSLAIIIAFVELIKVIVEIRKESKKTKGELQNGKNEKRNKNHLR